MAIKYNIDISFALHDRWLTSLVINEFLETSNKDINKPREIKTKTNQKKMK